eukprot:3758355-Amphidinium_carterae.1
MEVVGRDLNGTGTVVVRPLSAQHVAWIQQATATLAWCITRQALDASLVVLARQLQQRTSVTLPKWSI